MNACTIVARNYLAQARVLAESFLEHHPEGRFTTLVLDRGQAPIPTKEPFRVLGPEEIGITPRELRRMAMLYSVMELATAVKPWLLRTLLREDDHVVYFDPDIEVYAPLDDIAELAREHSIVLTPHLTIPAPREIAEPEETTILLAGAFNLGFLALGARQAQELFAWWSERLARDCIVMPDHGRFVDQRWFDLVPGLFDHAIVREPGCNVAWWNLRTRELTWTGEHYEVDGQPLRFFHFSGYDPEAPYLLSKHQGTAPPIKLSEHDALARICGEYAAKLRAHGFERTSSLPYGYDRLTTGMPVDDRIRKIYRQGLISAEQDGDFEPPIPFDPVTDPDFVEWLRRPWPHSPNAVSRFLEYVYVSRPDVVAEFPNLRWYDGQRFVDWIYSAGRVEESIPYELMPPRPADGVDGGAPAQEETVPGVTIAGYFKAEVGVGEAGRKLVAAVEQSGMPFRTFTYTDTWSRQQHPFGERGTSAPYDTNIVCVNADRFLKFRHDVGPGFFDGRYSIGVWWWEVARFPMLFHPSFDPVDEIWVGSDFVREAIGRETLKPVLTVPLPVEVPAVPSVSRAQLGLPPGFLFLFVFDFFSIFERKNPLGLIEAFARAFAPGEGPSLVIKSINGDQSEVALERLRGAIDRPDIHLLDGYVSAEERNAMMAACDCYVSLHRSEGFGLTMAEAMAYGKPTIATGYSGNLTFMNEENSYLVPHGWSTIPSTCWPYPAGVEWAEPDVDAAASLMRDVYERQDEARARGAVARESMRERHSLDRVAEFIAARVEEIRAERRGEPAPAVARPSLTVSAAG